VPGVPSSKSFLARIGWSNKSYTLAEPGGVAPQRRFRGKDITAPPGHPLPPPGRRTAPASGTVVDQPDINWPKLAGGAGEVMLALARSVNLLITERNGG
jgi:hypothetical protein